MIPEDRWYVLVWNKYDEQWEAPKKHHTSRIQAEKEYDILLKIYKEPERLKIVYEV